MLKRSTRCSVLILSLLLLSAGLSGQSPLSSLGVSDGQGRDAFFESLLLGIPRLPKTSGAFAAASDAMRVSMVGAACTAARAYVDSSEFASRYADQREANGPGPEPKAPTIDDVLVNQRKAFEEQVRQMQTQLTELTPAQVQTLETGWAEVRKRMADMETGPGRVAFEAQLQQRRAQQMRAYQQAVQEHDARWPRDGRSLVAIRLREFLAATADVDYGARVVSRDGVQVFEHADLEARPGMWKLVFRARKPAGDAARDCATQWLASLPSGPA
jgi:hypothetical protein